MQRPPQNAGFADSGGVYAALCSPLFVQADLVGDHRDELTIRGFAAEVVDGVTEVAVQSVHIAAVPGDLDGMADSTFDAAGRGTVALGDFRVETLGHGVDVLVVGGGKQDGIPQELVALDVGRHADLVQDLGDGKLIGIQRDRLRAAGTAGGTQYPADQHVFIERLHEKERETVI